MAEEKKNMLYSTDDIWLGDQTNRCLTDDIAKIYEATDFLPDNYAAKEHVHSEYATKEELGKKADAEHNHDDAYYKKLEVDEMIASLKTEIAEMIANAIADKAADENASADSENAASKVEDASSETESVSE